MPKHVQWGEELAEEASGHSLAGWVARSDRQLDDEIELGAPIRAVREARRSDEPSAPRRRVERDETARWSSEIEVVRVCVRLGPPQASPTRTGGDLGRALDRIALGTAGVRSSGRVAEPDLGSDHYRHAWRIWSTTLDARERRMLSLMYAELGGRNDGGADRIARTVRTHLQHGNASEAEAALPACAVHLPAEGASAAALVAIVLGWAREDATRLEAWPDAPAVRSEVSAARTKLRTALRRVELDASGESLTQLGDRLPSGTKPLLIPAASSRELERATPLRTVAVCLGLGPVVDGVRTECEVEVLEVRVEALPRCPACSRPRR